MLRARLLRLEGAQVEDAERELAEAERFAGVTSTAGLVPGIHGERAAL